MKKNLRLLLFMFFFMNLHSSGQTLQLLKDINAGATGSFPNYMIQFFKQSIIILRHSK